MMNDDLTIPDFLDRKKNGITAEPLPKTRVPRARTPKKQTDTVRVYLRNRLRGLSCGWHVVSVVSVGSKHVRFRALGKTKGVRVSRAVWDSLQKG